MAIREKDFLVFRTTLSDAKKATIEEVTECDNMIKRLGLDYYKENFSKVVKKVGLTNPEYNNIIPFFYLEKYRAVSEGSKDGETYCHAMVTIKKSPNLIMEAGDGVGIVNAIWNATNSAVRKVYDQIDGVILSNFEVTTLDSESGSDQEVFVLIEFSDGENFWVSVGISDDLIRASWKAISRGLNFFLLNDFLQKIQKAV